MISPLKGYERTPEANEPRREKALQIVTIVYVILSSFCASGAIARAWRAHATRPRIFRYACRSPLIGRGAESVMQFAKQLRERIRRGEITCSVRIWTRPHVKPGGRYRLAPGEIEVDSIEPMELADVSPALARESGFPSLIELLKTAKHGSGSNVYLVRFHYVPPSSGTARGGVRTRKTAVPSRAAASARRRVVRIAESFPGGAARAEGAHLSLEVNGSRFGWFLSDHNGDGRLALNLKASAEMHDMLRRLAPEQFHLPKYLGAKGWVGLWLDVGDVDWAVVELALREAYVRTAPKRLARQLASGS
jgi:hypothetical protein